MKRKPALALAATAAMITAVSTVALPALTGSSLFGIGTSAPSVTSAPVTSTPGRSAALDARQAATGETLPAAIVMQTSVVDEIVVVAKRPQAASSRPAGDAAATEPTEPAPAAAAPTAATTASTAPPAATTVATPAPTTTTAPSTPGVSAPLNVTFPADWGTRPVPPMPTPPAGTHWSECALHSDASWECQHP